MKSKDLRLDIEALFSQAIFGHGFLHYGYWPKGNPEILTLEKFGEAQQAYFNKFTELIPRDVLTILDVGSGLGGNAKQLLRKGYSVDCVCPSARLNCLAREKLPKSVEIFECDFEDFKTERRYDMALFCESFHYMHAEEALVQMTKYAKKYVLIFDYFKKIESDKNDRITYKAFQRLANHSPFKISHDEDLTEAINPTFLIFDHLTNTHVKPFTKILIKEFRREHPIYSFLFSIPLRKLEKRIENKSSRYQNFPQKHEYRLILMEKEA